MRIFFLVSLLLTFTITTRAQNDPKAKAILDKVSVKLKSLKSMKANFSITISGAKGSKPQTKKGKVMMKGGKYYVALTGTEIFCDARTIWTYMKESNEVQISNFDPKEDSFTPSKLFTNFYDKEYSYKYAGTQTIAGKKVDVITLTPTNKTKQYTRIDLMIDQAQSTVSGGKMYEKSGNVYSYSVSGYTSNPTLDDVVFVFNQKKYPGVEVVDLR